MYVYVCMYVCGSVYSIKIDDFMQYVMYAFTYECMCECILNCMYCMYVCTVCMYACCTLCTVCMMYCMYVCTVCCTLCTVCMYVCMHVCMLVRPYQSW